MVRREKNRSSVGVVRHDDRRAAHQMSGGASRPPHDAHVGGYGTIRLGDARVYASLSGWSDEALASGNGMRTSMNSPVPGTKLV